jgi:hypothetical protein
MRLIDDGSEYNFLDKVVVGGRRFDRSLADLHASLERAAWVLEQKTARG